MPPTAANRYQGDYGDDGHTRYLQAVDGIGFGEGRAQGVTRVRNFYHEELGIGLARSSPLTAQTEAPLKRLNRAYAGDVVR